MVHILGLAAFIAIALIVFLAVRWVIKHPMNFPRLGRITAFGLMSLATILDQLNALPWGQILSEPQAKMVGFAIAGGMAILHVFDMAKANFAPPADTQVK